MKKQNCLYFLFNFAICISLTVFIFYASFKFMRAELVDREIIGLNVTNLPDGYLHFNIEIEPKRSEGQFRADLEHNLCRFNHRNYNYNPCGKYNTSCIILHRSAYCNNILSVILDGRMKNNTPRVMAKNSSSPISAFNLDSFKVAKLLTATLSTWKPYLCHMIKAHKSGEKNDMAITGDISSGLGYMYRRMKAVVDPDQADTSIMNLQNAVDGVLSCPNWTAAEPHQDWKVGFSYELHQSVSINHAYGSNFVNWKSAKIPGPRVNVDFRYAGRRYDFDISSSGRFNVSR